MTMMQKTTWAVLAGSFLLAACSTTPTTQAVESAPIPVNVTTAGSEHRAPGLTASGRIEARESANISTRIMGYVNAIHVKTGDEVKRGQLLANISSTDVEAQMRQAEAGVAAARAAYANAQKDLARFEGLFAKNSATRKELDDITTHFNMAKAGLDAAVEMKSAAAAQLVYARITAPFTGKIVNVFLKEGEMANPGMPILSIEGEAGLQAVVPVPESDISLIKEGMKAEVLVKSLGKTFKGDVSEISSSSRNTGGQYLVKIDIEGPGEGILSGMFVEAGFALAEQGTSTVEGTLVIPASAIVRKGQLAGVYVVNDRNVALLRWLRLGREWDERVEVLSGLTPGEHYITRSEDRLYNGATVVLSAS